MIETRTFLSRLALMASTLSLLPALARAQEASASADAARHFDRGYLLAQQGNLEAAIAEFSRAYAVSPHPIVLYNLGQAYAASGRAVEAVQTLQTYLKLADAAEYAKQRADAAALIEYQSQRIGALRVDVEPAGAELSIDGTPVGRAPLTEPLPLVAGAHALTVSAPGFLPHTQRVEVLAKTTTAAEVRLRPNGAVRLRVRCDVPDVIVSGDGRRLGELPRGGELRLPESPRELRFERAGFVAQTRPFPAQPEQLVSCDLGALDPEAALARVAVDAPSGFVVHVDGQRFRGGLLAPGRHVVAVSGPGIEPGEHSVVIGPSARRIELSAREASASLQGERERRRNIQRTSAVVVGAAGAVSLGASAVLYGVNQAGYRGWREDSAALASRMRADPSSVSVREWDELFDRSNGLRNRDALALGGAVLGGALVSAAAVLWLTAPRAPDLGVTLHVGRTTTVGYAGAF